jgi:hypothetical protein
VASLPKSPEREKTRGVKKLGSISLTPQLSICLFFDFFEIDFFIGRSV